MNLLLVSSAQYVLEDRERTAPYFPKATIRAVASVEHAQEVLSQHPMDCVVICAPIDGCSPEQLVEHSLQLDPQRPVVVRNREGSFAEANRCMNAGATAYIGPGMIGTEEERKSFAKASGLVDQCRLMVDEPWMRILVGRSAAMRNVAQIIKLVASRRCNVLITGETGTGKELAARAIHAASSRANNQLISVNCGALPENLIEAELFGHTRGAFTGASAARAGRFEDANKSTIFLDEVADLPLPIQTKLLRVLQEREVQRLGSSESIKVDFRLIAACNVNLLDKIRDGQFREDLYYRLHTIPLELPALRERREDIPLLVRHFVSKISNAEGIPVKQVSDEAMDRLCAQHWPGNVRQLEHTVEMAIALSGERSVLSPADFKLAAPLAPSLTVSVAPPRTVAAAAGIAAPATPMPAATTSVFTTSGSFMPTPVITDEGLDYDRVVGEFERRILQDALRRTNGNKKAAADILRLKRTTLNAKLKSLDALMGATPEQEALAS